MDADKSVYYGEIDDQGRITWSSVDYDSASDLFATPVRVGRRVKVPSYYNEHDHAEFAIVNMTRL